ncbi:MAG: MFS transporter [Candidatus Omnitrophica bacterium]|nr:MFS transporter [Candidatus Omnitrophota bacterium]
MKTLKDRVKSIEPLMLILRAFRYRNYRLFFGGQSISLVGTWMQQIAMSWLVFKMTGSVFLLGVVGFASQLPVSILVPFAGVLADRWDRYRILIATQTLAMAQAIAVYVLVATGRIEVWQIIALSVLLGIVNAFDVPARQAFVFDLVEKRQDLGNAIALNSLIFNAARLIGPSIAGMMIAISGEKTCFLVNALSYSVVIIALFAMRIVPRKSVKHASHIMHGLKEGVAYALRSVPIRSILLILGLISIAGVPYAVLMPAVATEILGGGPQVFGFLVAASGLGALIGALYLASRRTIIGFSSTVTLATGLFGVGLFFFSLSRVLVISLVLMLVVGLSMMVQIASSNTILQTIVDDDKRGRVMSFYTMAFLGTAPFGSLLAGGLASRIGVSCTLMIGGIACVAGSAFFAIKLPSLRKAMHPIYARMGIITEVSTGIQSATELIRPPED